MADDDFTAWLQRLQRNDPQAAQRIWEEYFTRLARLAGRRMEALPRRVADEEDVALSAIDSFLERAREGRFPQLHDENDLWRLLVTITSRKVNVQRRRHFAARRGGGKVRGESIFRRAAGSPGIDACEANEPTPQFAAQVAEQCRALFDRLDDPLLRNIARWKMEGFSNQEIAQKLGRNVRTVERKLSLIRKCWSDAQ